MPVAEGLGASDTRYLERVTARLSTAEDLATEDAGTLVAEAVRFLSLAQRVPGPLSPAPAVDSAWHELLRDRARYRSLCRGLGGRVVSHQRSPGSPIAYYVRAREAAKLRYGALDMRYWPDPAVVGALDCYAAELPDDDDGDDGGSW
jgi:hypothetical protein